MAYSAYAIVSAEYLQKIADALRLRTSNSSKLYTLSEMPDAILALDTSAVGSYTFPSTKEEFVGKKALVSPSELTAIANAIRSKNGTQTQYTVAQMSTAIMAIDGTSSGGSDPGTTHSNGNLTEAEFRSLGYRFPANVLNAFVNLDFKVTINSNVGYSSYFDARAQRITLRSIDLTDLFHVEMGRFIAFCAGNIDKSTAFASTYENEKENYPGAYPSIAQSSAANFFAYSVLEYVFNKDRLRTVCPNTYSTIETAISKITDAQVNYMKNLYGAVWAQNNP